jgi:pyridoxine kinase
MNLLSIQSHVAYGHVGNAAAIFPLQRLGIEVWPIHTLQFSNHPGYGAWRGGVFDGGMTGEIVQGIRERGVLGTCDGVLSGYMGSAEIGEAILAAVAQVREANPAAQYCCDPVIGDVGRGLFVAAAVAELITERAVPAADVITPNQFELEQLTGCATPTTADALAAVDRLHARGPRVVLVTSLKTRETPHDSIDVLVSDVHGRFRVRTPHLPLAVNGAGDALAALFFAHMLRSGSAAQATSLAVSAIFGVLCRTLDAGSREILLVDAQDEIVAPSRMFAAEPV